MGVYAGTDTDEEVGEGGNTAATSTSSTSSISSTSSTSSAAPVTPCVPCVPFVVFSASVCPEVDDISDFAQTASRLAESESARDGSGGAMVFDSLMVRHWDTWDLYRTRSLLFLAHLSEITPDHAAYDDAYGGEGCWVVGPHVAAINDASTDCPPKPFGGDECYDICPGGGELAFAARPPQLVASAAWSTTVALYTTSLGGAHRAAAAELCAAVAASGEDARGGGGESKSRDITTTSSSGGSSGGKGRAFTGAPLEEWTRLTALESGTSDCPRYSLDGSTLAYLHMLRPGYEADRQHIMLFDRRSGKTRRAVPNVGDGAAGRIDLSFDSIVWGPLGIASKVGGWTYEYTKSLDCRVLYCRVIPRLL